MLKEYNAAETANLDSVHTVKLTVMRGEAKGEVVVKIAGMTCGAEVLSSASELAVHGLNLPRSHRANQIHCRFDQGEAVAVYLFHPTKGKIELDMNEAQQSVIAADIIGYSEEFDESLNHTEGEWAEQSDEHGLVRLEETL